VLVTVATRLRRALRPGDTLARFGGDEFVVLCEGVTSEAAALALAERLRTALEAPIEVGGGEETTLTLSVGIAYAGPDGTDETAETLVRDADAAMYRAKERGRDRHELFDITTRLIALARHETVNALRRATERGEMVVHYQPQVDIASERVVGVEALVRWNHPERGLLTPAEFISLAEETGIIVPLGARVLAAACRQAVTWERRDDLPGKLCLSVNLAARQLLASDLCGVIEDVLRTSGLDASQLCLEITESVLLEDTEASARALGDVKALGVRIAVDDFGTGFSALSYLKRFPVDVLKIDQSFVRDINSDPDTAAIVTAIIAMAHSLRLKVIAEGVEFTEQLDFLRSHGCDQMQGYLLKPPVAAEEFLAFLREG
jgi:EAL domain-containing protein (putative c-di-GMP-specific phosphodiesterase class I)